MALPSASTLEDVRSAVLARCNYATGGNLAANVRTLADECIRSAQSQLYAETEWLVLRTTSNVTLTDGTQSYDFPDGSDIGKVFGVAVINLDGREFPVDWGLRQNERDAAKTEGAVATGRPLVVQIVDESLKLWPAPDTNYPTLILDYYLGVNYLADNETLVLLDAELVTQAAAIKFKRAMNRTIDTGELAEHERYLGRLISLQSSGEGLQLGGHQSWRNTVQKRNRVATGRRQGNGAPWNSGWNPW